jgi:hypothetical protein
MLPVRDAIELIKILIIYSRAKRRRHSTPVIRRFEVMVAVGMSRLLVFLTQSKENTLAEVRGTA